MAQHDYDIANQSFPSFRSDLNSVLEAINTSNSGTSRPSSAVAGTIWLDSTNATSPTLKFYDGSDDISLATLDYTANTVNWLDSTVSVDIVGDTTPQLGGNLDVNGNSIVSVANGNITITPDGTGKLVVSGLSYPTADGTSGQNLITDGAGNLSFSNVIPADNTVSLAKLTATGTKDATTFLRGDNTFAEAGGGGKIGQVVSTTKTDTFSESVGAASFSSIVTGLTVSITPSATTSKILVLADMNIGADGSHGLAFQLFRDTTQIDLADASSSRARLSKGRVQNSGGGGYVAALSTNFLDSPSSTSELTYGVKIGHTSISAKSLYINRSHDDTNDASFGRGASTITVMEILA